MNMENWSRWTWFVIGVILAFLATSCSSTPIVRTVEVKVPVAVYCEVVYPPVPEWEYGHVKKEDALFTKVKSLLIELKQREAYEQGLLGALKQCER